MPRLIGVDDALRLVLDRAPPAVAADEAVAAELAVGRTLFEDVRADADFPAWPRSRVDGYAVRAEATPGEFAVTAEVPAGKPPGDRIGAGAAARIFTGGTVPDGGDAVVMQEDVTAGAGRVRVAATVAAGENVVARGSECAAGGLVAARGTVVTPALVGALASVGRARIQVARRPPVVVLPTGNEIVPVGETPPPGRIRNSNAPALEAAVASYGGAPQSAGIAPDARPALDEAIAAALARQPDVLLLTGGVSVGDFDLVPAALADAGVEKVFHGVRLQPGKPLWFGVRGRALVFGLPGNPVSALVNAALFVRPALRRMSGRADAVPAPMHAVLGARVGPGAWRRRYVPARLSCGADARLVATPVRFAGSGDVFGFSTADALIVVPEESPAREAGEVAEVVSLSGTVR